MNIQKYNKAIAALIAGAIVFGLKQIGIVPDNDVIDAINVIVTAGAVMISAKNKY